jgi:DNA-binding CsgD family transcriptional regulator
MSNKSEQLKHNDLTTLWSLRYKDDERIHPSLNPQLPLHSTDQDINMQNDTLRYDLARLEAKIDIITNLLLTSSGSRQPEAMGTVAAKLNAAELALLRSLTPKQHATSQGLIMGWMNKSIGDVMGIGENTVKLHVRAVCKKIGCKTRGQAAMVLNDIIEKVSDKDYRQLSGGIPTSWARDYDFDTPDQYAAIYKKKEGTV